MIATNPTTTTFAARLAALVDAARGTASAADVARLSDLFTSERAERQSDYMADPRLRAAYLAFFVPQYAAKVALLLRRAQDEGLLTLPAAPRVLDVGAGPLTGVLGAWLAAGAVGGGSVALDLAAAALHDGKRVLDAVSPGAEVKLLVERVQRRPLPQGPFDVIVVAHVLNEIGDPRRALEVRTDLARDLVRLLAPGGRVLIVEPGTRVHGRALMGVRDQLQKAAARDVAILSPCRDAPRCPLLLSQGDWCHGELAWEPPPAFVQLSVASGLKKTVLKDSHLLLAPAATAAAPPRDGLRLVGGLMTAGGVERRYGCGASGLVELVGKPKLAPAASSPLRGALLRVVEDRAEKPCHRPAGDRGPKRREGKRPPRRG